MRLSLKESRMLLLNAINLDGKSGIRGPTKTGRRPIKGLSFPLPLIMSENRQSSTNPSEKIDLWNYLIDIFRTAPCRAGITVSTASCLSP